MPASFSDIPTANYWKEAFNRRQQVLQEHESLSRSAMQPALEIVSMKNLLESQSGKQFTPQTLSQELLQAGLQQVVGGSVKEEEGDKGAHSVLGQFEAHCLCTRPFFPIQDVLKSSWSSRRGTAPAHHFTRWLSSTHLRPSRQMPRHGSLCWTVSTIGSCGA